MRVPKVITVDWLRQQGACTRDQEQFASIFPNGVKVTARALRAAVKDDRIYGSVEWFIGQALTTLKHKRAFSNENEKACDRAVREGNTISGQQDQYHYDYHRAVYEKWLRRIFKLPVLKSLSPKMYKSKAAA